MCSSNARWYRCRLLSEYARNALKWLPTYKSISLGNVSVILQTSYGVSKAANYASRSATRLRSAAATSSHQTLGKSGLKSIPVTLQCSTGPGRFRHAIVAALRPRPRLLRPPPPQFRSPAAAGAQQRSKINGAWNQVRLSVRLGSGGRASGLRTDSSCVPRLRPKPAGLTQLTGRTPGLGSAAKR